MTVATASFGHRLRGVLALDPRAYEEVEADRSALGQAFLVVTLGSLSAGIGAGITGGLADLAVAVLLSLAGWAQWVLLVYVVGVHLLPEPQTEAGATDMMRVGGFAAAPTLFAGFAFVPLLGPIVQFIVGGWLMMTMIVGVRQALDFRSTTRAVGVVLIGAVAYATVLWVL